MQKLFLMLLAFITFANVDVCAQNYLNFTESDPNKMGWMQGFPPPKEKIVSATDGSFFRFPALRYSVCHMRQFMPTTVVKASAGKH
jgi:hypothetical protein